MNDTQPSSSPESFAPRGPLGFFQAALRGGFGAAALQFMLGWLAFQVLTSTGWAWHMRNLAGRSSLPTYWGEFLGSRDVWEMLEHGGLAGHPFGFWAAAAGLAALFWILWFGWRMQAAAVSVRPGLTPWIRGFAEALVLALPPLLLLRAAVLWLLGVLASTGIQSMGWMQLVGGAILHVCLGGLFMIQWWLCRLDLARPASAPHPLEGLWRHLVLSFLRLWLHPLHWGAIVLFGGLFRAGLFVLTLSLAWHWGGETIGKVALAGLLLGAATLLNAWIIGWTMRLTAHFWRHDRRVQDEVLALQQNLT